MRKTDLAAAFFAVSIGFGFGSGPGWGGFGLAPDIARAATAGVCTEGDADARLACLSEEVSALSGKLAGMESQMADKAERVEDDVPGHKPHDDIVRYGSVLTIRNQDMRLFARCLDNPGPDSPDMSQVIATSCAPAAGQSWIIMRPRD